MIFIVILMTMLDVLVSITISRYRPRVDSSVSRHQRPPCQFHHVASHSVDIDMVWGNPVLRDYPYQGEPANYNVEASIVVCARDAFGRRSGQIRR